MMKILRVIICDGCNMGRSPFTGTSPTTHQKVLISSTCLTTSKQREARSKQRGAERVCERERERGWESEDE